MTLSSTAEQLYRAARDKGARGDFRNHNRTIGRLCAIPGADPRAFAFDLSTQLALMGGAAERIDVDDEALSSVGHEAMRHALTSETRRALLAGAGAAPWLERLRAYDEPSRAKAEGWCSWVKGDYEQTGQWAAILAEQRDDPDSRVMGAMLSALTQLEEGEATAALSQARHAVRMARAEERLELEYLSGLVLARARRYNGTPHLSARILRALKGVAPHPYRPWIEWELTLATGHPTTPCLEAWTDAKTRAELEERIAKSRQMIRHTPMRRELALLADALLGRGAFSRGEEHALPLRLGATGAFVIARTNEISEGAAAVRILPMALRLHSHATPLVGQERSLLSLAHLALAPGANMTESALFRQLYGFAFDVVKHRPTLAVLLHRASQMLGEQGYVKREGDRISLTLLAAVCIPDPRCNASLEERVLVGISEGRDTASSIAKTLSVPLRTVQAALKGLVQEDACIAERDGRAVHYRVEDTSFHEPTLHRLSPDL